MVICSRWIRLVFTREVPFGLALQLWDGIFAEDPSLEIVDFVCIAMLLLIRNERKSCPLIYDLGVCFRRVLRRPVLAR